MRLHARGSLLVLIVGVLIALAAPAAAQAAGIASFFAANCNASGENCKKQGSPAEELKHAEEEGFTQAGGHPNFGITDFTVKTVGTFPNAAPEGAGEGAFITHIRTDVAPGLATDPEAVPKCSMEGFGREFEPAPGIHTGLYEAPECEPGSEIGVQKAVVWLGPEPSPKGGDLPLEGSIFNLVQPKGLASDFGVALPLPKPLTEALLKIPTPQLYAHSLIEGGVEWGAEPEGTKKADYHDFFEVNVSPSLPLISSRLTFFGNIGKLGFLTNPTSCTGTGEQTTTTLKLKFANGEHAEAKYSPPIGSEKCDLVPFNPGFALAESTSAFDSPDALTTELSLAHNEDHEGIDDSQVKTAVVRLPEGITLNPSAAAGLEDCTVEQFGIGTKNPIDCPSGSKVGSVTLDVPGLPDGSLKGSAYLGGPASGPITAPPYTLFVSAESERYGVVVRLEGEVSPDPSTGQLTATFKKNPEQPFSKLILHMNDGPLTSLANNLKCESTTASTEFTPFSGTAPKSPTAPFEVNGCPAPLPFSLSQGISNESAKAGGHTSFTFTLGREDGQQYLKKVRTTLPPGLVGAIPAVTLCGEPQAAAGTCSSASRIGTARVSAGAGTSPFTFSGPVYMTGPYNGAPFGLSVAVPAVAGPFNLGTIVTRATISVNQTTGQVTATSELPTIVGGIPIRLRSLNVEVTRQGFLFNPTNCGQLATISALTSTLGSTQENLSTPFQVEGCSSLPFKPAFSATSTSKTSKVNGASLSTTLKMPNDGANVKSVLVTLPKQLPSRLTTLQKACLEATFAANPLGCAETAVVGTVNAVTPTLPGEMKGIAVLVSHGGAAFPDLDLVLEGSGVRIILVGNTDIKNGITTTTFASTPDVPVSSITVNLPTGPHSALAAFGDLCRSPLFMPTTITGQNGAVVKQNTKINVTGCGVKIVGRKVIGKTLFLTVKTFAAGTIRAKGRSLRTVSKKLGSAHNAVSLKVPLSKAGRNRHRPFKVKVTVGFTPKTRSVGKSSSHTTVKFRR